MASIAPLLRAEDSAAPTPSPVNSPVPSGLKPATYFKANVDGQYIAMTFDDGPSPETTPRLLDILKQRNIKATFFMIGQNAERNPDIVKRILADGHEIGNHSWTHPQLAKLSDDRVSEEIIKTQNAIKNASGYTPNASSSALRIDYRSPERVDRKPVWLERHFLVGRSVRLEAARCFGYSAAHFGGRQPRGNHSFA